ELNRRGKAYPGFVAWGNEAEPGDDADDVIDVQPVANLPAVVPSAPLARRPPLHLNASFAEFWQAYPRKRDKKDAEKAFHRAVKSKRATPEELIAGAKRYAAEVAGKDLEHVKHAATWLNKESWTNEVEIRSIPKQTLRDTVTGTLDRMMQLNGGVFQ